MKKTFKKIGAALLVAAFLAVNLVPAMGAFAADQEKGSITIKNPEPGKSYDIYKIFDLTYSGKNVSYTIAEGWEGFFTTGAGKGYLAEENSENSQLNPIVVGTTTKRIKITKDNVDEFAAAAFAFAVKNKTPKTVTAGADATPVTASELDLGYYLVYPKGATDVNEGQKSIVSLTSTTPKGEVDIKATYPTITKEADKKTADYGEDITYTITGKVPDTTGYESYTYTITDTLSEGLTLDDKSVKVTVNNQPLTTGVTKTVEGQKLTLDFTNMKDLQGQVGQEIKVTYTAKLNEKAVIGKDGNANKAQLTYSNDPKESSKKETTPEKTVSVYTGSITIDKYDGKDESKKTKLSGAKFILKNTEGKYYQYDAKNQKVSWVDKEQAEPKTTDTNGKAEFKGIADGDYELVEIHRQVTTF